LMGTHSSEDFSNVLLLSNDPDFDPGVGAYTDFGDSEFKLF